MKTEQKKGRPTLIISTGSSLDTSAWSSPSIGLFLPLSVKEPSIRVESGDLKYFLAHALLHVIKRTIQAERFRHASSTQKSRTHLPPDISLILLADKEAHQD